MNFVRILAIALASILSVQAGASAEPTLVKPALQGIAFLIGSWNSGTGVVSDSGETSRGSSFITSEVNGSALLRRDHTELSDKSGASTGHFDQLMMIYPENGMVHADYSDGTHVIHYTSAKIDPDHSVAFMSETVTNGPTYRLSYTLTDADTLAVDFAIEPPGQQIFHSIASGSLKRNR